MSWQWFDENYDMLGFQGTNQVTLKQQFRQKALRQLKAKHLSASVEMFGIPRCD
ncbi:hypothetical protein O9992_28045 [Vibrio lentus]|nr:hypothetical protein [Vibrio lentus]